MRATRMELPEEVFRHHMDLMLFGPIQLCRQVIPYMRKQGWGRIINISSIFGKQPGNQLDYDSIKAALQMVTKDLSNHLARDNILVNAVCPGPIRTPLWEGPGALAERLGQQLGMSAPEVMKWFARTKHSAWDTTVTRRISQILLLFWPRIRRNSSLAKPSMWTAGW